MSETITIADIREYEKRQEQKSKPKSKPQDQKKQSEQDLLEEFTETSPVFTERFVLPFLQNKDILTSRLLGNIKNLVKDKATFYGYNHDPHLINTFNGVLNIETKQLEPRNGRLFDRILPKYDPKATAPTFKHLLNNYNTEEYPDLSDDLLKLFAYELFGNNKLKSFFIIHGNGDNAKSTLWNLVENALGSAENDGYATKLEGKTFTTERKSNFNVGLVSMNNSRFTFSDELKQGVELDGNLIKQLVAGEGSTIKFEEKGGKKQKSSNVISPVVLLVNDVPNFKNADQATINRIALVEFSKTFVRNDPEVKEQINHAMNEQAGIFNMILNAHDPDWTVPKRWTANAKELVNEQVFDDDVIYNLGEALKITVELTHDNRDQVRRAELHQALKVNYYNNHDDNLPTKRELQIILPSQFDIGIHGNYYTKILIK